MTTLWIGKGENFVETSMSFVFCTHNLVEMYIRERFHLLSKCIVFFVRNRCKVLMKWRIRRHVCMCVGWYWWFDCKVQKESFYIWTDPNERNLFSSNASQLSSETLIGDVCYGCVPNGQSIKSTLHFREERLLLVSFSSPLLSLSISFSEPASDAVDVLCLTKEEEEKNRCF